MPRIISIASNKGGVGKSVSMIHIAAILAKNYGFKTCVIDFDTSQANATYQLIGATWTNENYKEGICSVVIGNKNIDEVVYPTGRENLFIVPSEKVSRSGVPYSVEGNLSEMGIDGFMFLKETIESSEKLQAMDFIFIDVGPTLGQQLVTSLIAADYFLISVKTESSSVDAVSPALAIYKKVLKINPYLKPLGMYISLEDKRVKKNLKRALDELNALSKMHNIKLFENRIPINSNFSYLAREQKLIIDLKTGNRGAAEYEHLTNEILEEVKRIEINESKRNTESREGVSI